MSKSLYRTGVTSVSDDELRILDVMFDCGVTYPMLQIRNFYAQLCQQPHSLDDARLRSALDQMLANQILEPAPQ